MGLPEYFTRLTAGPEHIDELGHVNNAVWVEWIQQVAVAHWRAAAPADLVDTYIWVVIRHEIDYLRSLGPGESVAARTWVGDAPKGRASTATWNSPATTARSASAPRRSGRCSTRRRAAPSASRPKSSRRFQLN